MWLCVSVAGETRREPSTLPCISNGSETRWAQKETRPGMVWFQIYFTSAHLRAVPMVRSNSRDRAVPHGLHP